MKGNGGKIALSSMALFKVITGKNIYYLDTTYSIYWSLRHFMTEKMCIFVSFLPKVSVRQTSELRSAFGNADLIADLMMIRTAKICRPPMG